MPLNNQVSKYFQAVSSLDHGSGAFWKPHTQAPFEKLQKAINSKTDILILKSHVQWTDISEL